MSVGPALARGVGGAKVACAPREGGSRGSTDSVSAGPGLWSALVSGTPPDNAAKAAFLRILARHPELTIDELAELRARHGAGFGAITLAEIRTTRPRKRDRPRRGSKIASSSARESSPSDLPLRKVLRLLQSSDEWRTTEGIAAVLAIEIDEAAAAVAELVRRNALQTGFDGEWKYRG